MLTIVILYSMILFYHTIPYRQYHTISFLFVFTMMRMDGGGPVGEQTQTDGESKTHQIFVIYEKDSEYHRKIPFISKVF